MAKIYDAVNGQDVTLGMLERFRSYSYYHVVAICADTNTADALATNGNFQEMWDHPSNPLYVSQQTGCYNLSGEQSVPGENTYSDVKYLPIDFNAAAEQNNRDIVNGVGKYVILINGSTDAQFIVDRYSFIVANTSINNAYQIDASMTIKEPLGISFLDTILRAYDSLGTNHNGSVYVVKTFFVGYLYEPGGNNNDTIQVISDIPAAIYKLNEITGSISEKGSEFNLSMVGYGSGGGNSDQYSRFASTIPANFYDPKQKPTLSSVISEFETQLNKESSRQYLCGFSNTLRVVKNSNPNSQLSEDDLKNIVDTLVSKVTYKIQLDNVLLRPDYQVDDVGAANTTNSGTVDGVRNIQMRAGQDISSMIEQEILGHCTKIRKPAESGGDLNKTSYSITSSLKINEVRPCVREYEVIYHITAVVDVTHVDNNGVSLHASKNSETSTQQQIFDLNFTIDNPNERYERADVITFDYIYTGQNIDIIDFDITLSNGLGYLTSGRVVSPWKPNSNSFHKDQIIIPNQGLQRDRLGAYVGPLPIVNSIFKRGDTNNPQEALDNRMNINLNAGIETQDITIKIRGNDALLYCVDGSNPNSFDNKPLDNIPITEAFRNYSRCPKLAKINVSFPQTSDTTALSLSGDNYTRPFWHQGLYRIMTINSIFEEGEFTQELNLNAVQTPNQNLYTQGNSDKLKGPDSIPEIDPCNSSIPECASNDDHNYLTSIDVRSIPTMNGSVMNYTGFDIKFQIDSSISVLQYDSQSDTSVNSTQVSDLYVSVIAKPSPDDPKKSIKVYPPIWMTKSAFDALNREVDKKNGVVGKDDFIQNKFARYEAKEIPVRAIRSVINTAYINGADKTAIKTSTQVGNKTTCRELIKQKQQQLQNIKSGNKAIIDGIDKRSLIRSNTHAHSETASGFADAHESVGETNDMIYTNYIDSEHLNKTCTLKDIPLYSNLADQDRQDMDRAFTDSNADERLQVTLLLIAATESGSSGQKHAKSSQSSATGLFQFINSTWEEQVRSGRVPGVSVNTPNFQDLRTSVYHSTIAAVAFARDNIKRTLKSLQANGVMIDALDPSEVLLLHQFANRGKAIIMAHYSKPSRDSQIVNDDNIWNVREWIPYNERVRRANRLDELNVHTVADFYLYESQKMNRHIRVKK